MMHARVLSLLIASAALSCASQVASAQTAYSYPWCGTNGGGESCYYATLEQCIATTAGVYLALAPWALLVGLVVFVLAILITKYVSVGSIAAAVALPATVWIMSPQNLFLGIVTTALGALAIYKHKSNIQRLMAGTESRLGKKPEETK